MKRLFAIGDVHGCFDQLKHMIENKLNATTDDKIILVGDYIDRGEKIKETIDYIIKLRDNGFDIVTLRGNHEEMMLQALKTGDFSNWIWNGGESTLSAFGIGFRHPLEEKYLRFFEDLLWYYEEGTFLFVHAGFNDADPFNDRDSMIWTRNEVYSNPLLKGKIIVHGHTPITLKQCKERNRSKNHVINIDTGCVYSDPGYGTLTAIEVNSRELFFA